MKRRGLAIPLVMLFVICTLALAAGMFNFRREVKQQNVSNYNFLQANFLAQAAVQNVLLKCRILPQEAYDAGMAFQGYCPFQGVLSGSTPTSGTKSDEAMQIFISDCRSYGTNKIDWRPQLLTDMRISADDWKFEVASLTVIAAFTDLDKREFVLTAQIEAIGTVNELRGGRGLRSEVMRKTIELKRKIN